MSQWWGTKRERDNGDEGEMNERDGERERRKGRQCTDPRTTRRLIVYQRDAAFEGDKRVLLDYSWSRVSLMWPLLSPLTLYLPPPLFCRSWTVRSRTCAKCLRVGIHVHTHSILHTYLHATMHLQMLPWRDPCCWLRCNDRESRKCPKKLPEKRCTEPDCRVACVGVTWWGIFLINVIGDHCWTRWSYPVPERDKSVKLRKMIRTVRTRL